MINASLDCVINTSLEWEKHLQIMDEIHFRYTSKYCVINTFLDSKGNNPKYHGEKI